MKQFFQKIRRWWLFNLSNPVVRKGESEAFKWKFRRFWLEIETRSGNFKARFTASEHPYGYLVQGDADQTAGFAERLYYVGTLLTTSQKFVNDIDAAFKSYCLEAEKAPEVDEYEDQKALDAERQVQEYIEQPKRERRKADRETNRRFRKVEKAMKDGAGKKD